MAGKIKDMIDEIVKERSRGNPAIAEMTIAKLILKGINPNKFNSDSPDDLLIIKKLINIAKQLRIHSFENKGANIESGFSTKLMEEEAVLDIKKQLNINNIKLIIFFASPDFDQQKISKLMQKAFNESLVIGCSTAGEFADGKVLKNSVVAMAINSNIISDVKVEVVENMKEGLDLESAFSSFEEYYSESLYNMDTKKFVGITLIDGLSKKEEKIMDVIGNRTNVFFVGGSAGDNNRFIKTYVHANGKAFSDSAIIVMLKINYNAQFSIIKTQSFEVLDKTLIANKVNEKNREVIEFNNKPAALAYAYAVDAPSVENIQEYFMTHPLGVEAGKNLFVRCPQRVSGNNMIFYCNILEGMEVKLLKATNIIEDTKKEIESKVSELGKIDGIINFHCIHRTLQLKKENNLGKYAEIFKNIPTVGFSAYGEQFIGHMNQTSAMLVFKSNI